MASAIFFTTSKRSNSTLVPSGTGVTLDVLLKSGTSLINPVFRLSYATRPAWSMCSFEGRYYFVTDIVSVHDDLWDVSCRVDVLATYKSAILASRQFILYDTAANIEIVDGRLPIKTAASVSSNNIVFSPYYSALGTYILTAINSDGCDTYFLNASQLMSLLNGLTAWINGQLPVPTDVIEAVTNVGKYLIGSGNVMSNIKGVTWVPFDLSQFSGGNATIKIGLYDSGVSVPALGSGYQTISWTQRVNIPWAFTDWRRNEPYTQLYVYIPYIGSISLPPGNLVNDSAIDIQISINKVTGAMAAEIHGATSGEIVYVGSGSTGIAIPLGISSINAASAITGGITAAQSLLHLNPIGAVASAINSVKSNPQTTGGIAGGAGGGLNNNIIATTVSHDTAEAPGNASAVHGTPTFETKTLSALTGYVECQNASVSISGSDTERNEINTLLNGGVYIE